MEIKKMFAQLKSLFFCSPPLGAPPIEAAEPDASDPDEIARYGHLAPRGRVESIEEKSKRLNYRNWNLDGLKKRRYTFMRLADLPSTIAAEAADPWRVDAAGEPWVREPSDAQDVVADDDDAELQAQLAELDAEMAADDAASKAKFARLRAEAAERDSFLPYSEWSGDDDDEE